MQDPNERRVIQEERVQTPTGADAAVVENRVQVVPSPAEQRLATLDRAKQIVWFIIGLIIAVIALTYGRSYFETASLIAMAVYLLLGWLINRVLELVLAPRTPPMY